MGLLSTASSAKVVYSNLDRHPTTRRPATNTTRVGAASLSSKSPVYIPSVRKSTFTRRGCVAVRAALDARSSRPGETPEQTKERRLQESGAVEDRSIEIHTIQELDAFLTEAGDKLVLLSVESEDECDLGDNPDAWSAESEGNHIVDGTHVSMAPCVQLKSNIARVARTADDAVFLALRITAEDRQAQDLAKELGVNRFPTFQYYKHHELVWEHVGAGPDARQNVGEGVL
eukprot:CAMPEP_0197848022 /NCGR_PEP_ID=MMETSP1438-20131217/7805_1 /TAXON_ID=1461541 /ORGANISM="Pterosperma sp., Strain CCMP1384" /LENGTH=229 /DNA_ID=CAMNT_0043460137 /DNA_START=196 /DNA_END=882 /DNA_ORIENTATION=-